MTTESDNFEKRIKRIEELLESSNAEIIWNDRIIDPDTEQIRQIDITIKKNGKITHIECRKRSGKQNVMWIEELIGRKQSLGADKMIAVSDSGFTGPAIKKANAKGIFLRDIKKITAEEILNWGEVSNVLVGLFKYNNPKIELYFDYSLSAKITSDNQGAILSKLVSNNNPILSDSIKLLRDFLQKQKLSDTPEHIKMRAFFEPWKYDIDGFPIHGISISGEFYNSQLKYETASVLFYGEPNVKKSERTANVEIFEFDGFEISNSVKSSSICFDITTIPFPKNTIFNGRVVVNFPEHRSLKKIETIGIMDQSQFWIGKGTFVVGFVKDVIQ